MLIVQPRKGFILQSFWYVYSSELTALRAQIQMPQLDVFHLDLYELTDPCAGCGQKAYDKIPEQLVIPFEAGFEILIIGLADDIFQKGFLLHSHKRYFPAFFANALQVAVDCPQTQIDGLRLVVLYQPHLIRPQVLFRDTVVLRAVLPNGKKLRGYRVFREVCAPQVSFEFFYHSERPPFTMILYRVPFTTL